MIDFSGCTIFQILKHLEHTNFVKNGDFIGVKFCEKGVISPTKWLEECDLTDADLSNCTIYWEFKNCIFKNANIDGCRFEFCWTLGEEIRECDLGRIKAAVRSIFKGCSLEVTKEVISKIQDGRIDGRTKVDCLRGWVSRLSSRVGNFDGFSIEEVWLGHIFQGDRVDNNIFLRLTYEWVNELFEEMSNGVQSTTCGAEEEDLRWLDEIGRF